MKCGCREKNDFCGPGCNYCQLLLLGIEVDANLHDDLTAIVKEKSLQIEHDYPPGSYFLGAAEVSNGEEQCPFDEVGACHDKVSIIKTIQAVFGFP